MNDKSNTQVKTDSPQEQEIIAYIVKNGSITDYEVQEILGVKKTRAYNLMKSLKEKNLVYSQGRGEGKRYYMTDK